MATDDIVQTAINVSMKGQKAFCKFLSANDTGKTGGHQAGIYISKPSISLLFDTPGEKGSNKSRWVKIKWMDNFETDTRFIYYGQGTRNEYRITNFGHGFPYLKAEYTGALVVLVKDSADYYEGFVFNTDDEIDEYLSAFGLTPAETNRLIDTSNIDYQYLRDQKGIDELNSFLDLIGKAFPNSKVMSAEARKLQKIIDGGDREIITNPDKELLKWTDTEYGLFRSLENNLYLGRVKRGFDNVQDFVDLANEVLNRRKSRAGKSLEHHLEAIFDANHLKYTPQAVTEEKKKPDFIFPSETDYHNSAFPTEKLISLAAKTTCKDRWRQVITESDRLLDRPKYLCTLQQGISEKQMDEMSDNKVVLVVPKPYIRFYPPTKQKEIWTISKFVKYVKESEGIDSNGY